MLLDTVMTGSDLFLLLKYTPSHPRSRFMQFHVLSQDSLCLPLQEVKDLKAELADVKKIKTTATVSTSPTRPSTPHFASPNLSAFEAELHRSCNAHPRFVTWLSELDKVSYITSLVCGELVGASANYG